MAELATLARPYAEALFKSGQPHELVEVLDLQLGVFEVHEADLVFSGGVDQDEVAFAAALFFLVHVSVTGDYRRRS